MQQMQQIELFKMHRSLDTKERFMPELPSRFYSNATPQASDEYFK
jgi:hypothetical protein